MATDLDKIRLMLSMIVSDGGSVTLSGEAAALVADAITERHRLSSALRAMARRASELRRVANSECQGRYVAEQNLRYAPISGVEQYRREISAAFFARQQVPPVPWPIIESKEQ